MRLHPYVRSCGDDRRDAWLFLSRKLLDYLLVYIEEGRGRFVIAGKTYAAEPGDLFWIPPDTSHEMEGYPPTMVCPYVHFDLIYRPRVSHWRFTIPAGTEDLGDLKPLLHPRLSSPQLDALCGQIRNYNNAEVGRLIREICREAVRNQPYATLRMSGLLLEIMAELLRGQQSLPAEQHCHIPSLEETADHLAQHCHEPISLEELADRCDLSPSHFRLLFGQHFGCSPRSYLRRTRIRRARELMAATTFTLSQIALKTGFSTVHSFSRAFHSVEGIAPSEYRRKLAHSKISL